MARAIGWTTLPDGLATDVGERGGRLSMGQRQLVALMRVLVQKPAIFILDEATASIDPFTEEQIQEALDLILGSSTAIVIAHRLSAPCAMPTASLCCARAASSKRAATKRCWRRAATMPSCTTRTFATNRSRAISEYGKLRAATVAAAD